MDYKIEELQEMIIVQAEGKTREDGKEKLEEFLGNQNIKPVKFYYLELYNSSGVAGAYTFARVNETPEHSRKFSSRTIDAGPYFVLEMSYQELRESSGPKAEKKLDLQHLIKETGYKVAELPFFEFVPDTDEKEIRIYVKLK
ncbi:MAG: hypothetical protein JXB08_02150 [Bacilli bacterium]|nr:hypothetical protein [Bacilli bacterium]MBN2876164.1 hypothetical protein [Bacilli bacterium]